jgi:hypothetical protein
MHYDINKLTFGDKTFAEIQTDKCLLHTLQDGLNLIGKVYFDGFDGVILHQHQLTPDFFILKNKLAGEILQKFSTYRLKLAIVGQFDELREQSKSVHDFIFESNKGKMVGFVGSTQEAFVFLCKK